MKLDRIERFLAAALTQTEPSMTVTAFAKRVNRGRNTIHKMIAAGKIRKEAGRIPADQLKKFLS